MTLVGISAVVLLEVFNYDSLHFHNLQSLFNLCLSLKPREREGAGRVLLDPLDFRCGFALLQSHLPSIPLCR